MPESLPINPADMIVIGVILLSGIFAFARGFVHEVLAILGWFGAIVITIYAFPYLRHLPRPYLPSELISDIVTGTAIFIVSVTVLTYISHSLAERVRDSAVSALDRSLGFIFGLVRGAVIVSAVWVVMAWVISAGEMPSWIREARSLPLVQKGAELLVRLIPADNRQGLQDALKRHAATIGKGIDSYELYRKLIAPPTARQTAPDDGDKGYSDQERRQLERLYLPGNDAGGEPKQ